MGKLIKSYLKYAWEGGDLISDGLKIIVISPFIIVFGILSVPAFIVGFIKTKINEIQHPLRQKKRERTKEKEINNHKI